MTHILPDNLTALLNRVGHNIYKPLTELSIEAWLTDEPLSFAERMQGEHRILNIGDSWGGLFDCAWMKLTSTVPSIETNQELVLMIDVGGEGLVVDTLGSPIRGITNKMSSYGIPPDKPGKWVVELNGYQEADAFEIWVDAGCNDLFGYVQNGGVITDAHLGQCNKQLKDLYYDLEVLIDWIKGDAGHVSHQPKGAQAKVDLQLESNEERFERFIAAMNQVDKLLVDYTASEIEQCRSILCDIYQVPAAGGSVDITATGHAHLDLAWMWPLREGKRKAMRTFATAVANLDKYEDYLFGASQYQLFEWVQEEYPELFERIQHHVKQGRFELQGCFWVESDLNLVSGESLIRQVMFGRQYTQEHFGQSVNYLWEPDVFGFTAALPQILVKSGVKYIASQKLSQNKVNPFPHHLFKWQGLDGSELIMHNFPEDTYDSRARATSVLKLEANYKEKAICNEALMVYGVGDGGGGPAEEHIERFQRIQNLDGLPVSKNGRVDAFFERVEKQRDRLPILSGELYFEAHQGCFTTESRTKQGNRDMEFLLGQLEALMAINGTFDTESKRAIDQIWKRTLTLQFHDILPGSSIVRVYEEAESDYVQLREQVNALIYREKTRLEASLDTSEFVAPYIVYNLSPYARSEWIRVDDSWQKVELAAMSYQIIEKQPQLSAELVAKPKAIENDVVRVEFSENGQVISLFNKALNKEFISKPCANRLTAYKERAVEYAAWDFADDYRDGESYQLELVESHAESVGPKVLMKQVYRLGKSLIKQDIVLTQGSARVDFVTDIDWREQDISLKANFPVTVQAREAQCNIQFGVLDRPTHSYDSFAAAKDEIPAHRWVDVTDGKHGVAVMADAKYGYRVKEQALEITLLRSQKKPGSEFGNTGDVDFTSRNFGDIGQHRFTYSILTHKGDYREGGVVQQGYSLRELAANPIAVQAPVTKNGLVTAFNSIISCDNDGIVVETLKPAESGEGVIVRLFETFGRNAEGTLSWQGLGSRVREVNLMEEAITEFEVAEGRKHITINPYEIITLHIV
ncbi:alpha-mannosidase [Vibrio sp. WXL103]|uniref:alpha-mannosidase n=1 Tax=Vibrio sp. WXL103 TaxID=3450710 RepID=UPI003EC5D301